MNCGPHTPRYRTGCGASCRRPYHGSIAGRHKFGTISTEVVIELHVSSAGSARRNKQRIADGDRGVILDRDRDGVAGCVPVSIVRFDVNGSGCIGAGCRWCRSQSVGKQPPRSQGPSPKTIGARLGRRTKILPRRLSQCDVVGLSISGRIAANGEVTFFDSGTCKGSRYADGKSITVVRIQTIQAVNSQVISSSESSSRRVSQACQSGIDITLAAADCDVPSRPADRRCTTGSGQQVTAVHMQLHRSQIAIRIRNTDGICASEAERCAIGRC